MIYISGFEILMQMINFLILLWVLHRLLYKPLLSFLEKREKAIKENHEKSEANKKAAENILVQQKNLLKQANFDAKKIREDVEVAANKEKELFIQKAKLESKQILDSARKDIQIELQKTKRELMKEVGDLSIAIAEKVIKKNVNKAGQEELIQNYLKTLDS